MRTSIEPTDANGAQQAATAVNADAFDADALAILAREPDLDPETTAEALVEETNARLSRNAPTIDRRPEAAHVAFAFGLALAALLGAAFLGATLSGGALVAPSEFAEGASPATDVETGDNRR